ncbi:hypothetical protein [Desulfosporosinus nitroreducens]|uniref:Secreted protein n=1 Tax=Desulfosporosinus nitroreducens TaxID=2018668 RepID=A0ABT8QVP9_9FIRM|nr:hypothetical protein [Desulfosporosinus nitroreducens]MDO0824942.1 hypothetical protein [Desulfosporosinus nitroreducens]
MNMKKYIIGTTLALLLCLATNVFATFIMGGISYLNTGILYITSSSKTYSDYTCSRIYAYNGIYEDGVLKKQSNKELNNTKSVTTPENSTTNSMGDQLWESYGIHNATINGVSYLDSSITTKTW